MTDDYTEKEIDRLHEELSAIYRRGALTATEKVTVQGLWARIERLDAARIAARVRDTK